MREKIFVTHKLPGVHLEKLKERFEVGVWPERDIRREVLLEKVKGVSGIISLLTEKIDGELMEVAGESLRVVGNYAVGYDNIDIEEASRRGIVVVNTPGVLTEAVAEHTVAMALALARRIVEGDDFVRMGKYKGWEPDLLIGTGLRGKTMGIVGLGRIGRWVGRVASGIGMKIVYHSPDRDEEYEMEYSAAYKSLNDLYEVADVVSLNVPLTEETRGMVGEEQFARMKRTALLINTARGAVVKEKDLVKALKTRRIAGAGLDVFEDESNISAELRSLPNVVLTPHIASATIDARLMMAKLVVEGVGLALASKLPDNIVNKDIWEKRRRKKENS